MTDADIQAVLAALRAARRGDLTVRLTIGGDPVADELAREWNGFMDDTSLLARELTALAGEVAGDGRLGGRARIPAARGTWRELSGGVNRMVWTVTEQLRALAALVRAVARGELGQRITVQAQGEVLELKNTINALVEKLEEERPPTSPGWLASPGPVEPASAQLSGVRVLVVDDDVRNVLALASVLEAQQMELLFAENGRQSIEVLEHDAPVDVVLMDIMVPELDGLEVMRRLRQDPRYVRLPIIAVAAQALPEDRQKCLEAGASAYLTKPFDTTRLLATIRQSLGL